MKAGKNVWKCDEQQGCGHEFRAEETPQECPECKCYIIVPKYNAHRVHGRRFRYYAVNSDWELSANDRMIAEARRANDRLDRRRGRRL